MTDITKTEDECFEVRMCIYILYYIILYILYYIILYYIILYYIIL